MEKKMIFMLFLFIFLNLFKLSDIRSNCKKSAKIITCVPPPRKELSKLSRLGITYPAVKDNMISSLQKSSVSLYTVQLKKINLDVTIIRSPK